MVKTNPSNSPRAKEPNSLRLVFFGTPDYVLPVVEALKNAGYDIAAVVTQPPKPVGRQQNLTPSAVAGWAKKQKIQIIDDRGQNVIEQLKAADACLAVLAAYGRIIPPEIIDLFSGGILNIHPSLLPAWRGASPIEAALVANDQPTGVTIIKIDKQIDHGPIVAQLTEKIKADDTKTTLRNRLFQKAAAKLVEILPPYLNGKITLRQQDHRQATFTTPLKKEHGFIPPPYLAAALSGEITNQQWNIPFIKNYSLIPNPQCLERFIRAMDPWPGVYTIVKSEAQSTKFEKRLRILKAHLEQLPITHLILDQVQLEGKKPVAWKQFQSGYPTTKFT